MSGVCYGLATGNLAISYMVRRCSGSVTPNSFTGGGSSFHIFVEELHLVAAKICSGEPVAC